MNMDKYFMWNHYERLHNHNKAKHNNTVDHASKLIRGLGSIASETIVTVELFFIPIYHLLFITIYLMGSSQNSNMDFVYLSLIFFLKLSYRDDSGLFYSETTYHIAPFFH